MTDENGELNTKWSIILGFIIPWVFTAGLAIWLVPMILKAVGFGIAIIIGIIAAMAL